MDDLALCCPAFIAGFVYIVSPGPVFLAILSIVSEKGRRSGVSFAAGAFFGDIVWLLLTFLFLIGASRVPELVLMILSGACAFYLFWLGYKMITAARSSGSGRIFPHPFKNGVTLGVLNPKSYPVLISVFSALVLYESNWLSFHNLPMLMSFSCIGFIAGYGVMIAVAGFRPVKSIYVKNLKAFSIVFGLVFIGFGIKLLTGIHG